MLSKRVRKTALTLKLLRMRGLLKLKAQGMRPKSGVYAGAKKRLLKKTRPCFGPCFLGSLKLLTAFDGARKYSKIP